MKVPALYLSNYSRAIDLADELSLVRPDQSYRGEKDEECQEFLDNPLAVYMVYTLEEGDARYHIQICKKQRSSLFLRRQQRGETSCCPRVLCIFVS